MIDRKLTVDEIKKALEYCANPSCLCSDCILYEPNDDECQCSRNLKLNALDLINRQNAENSNLTSDLTSLKNDLTSLNAEIERLKNALTDHEYGNCVAVKNGLIYTHTLEDYDNLIGDISAEAYKEFAERLKEKHRRITDYDEAGFGCQVFVVEEDCIDNLVKEVVGDSE